MSLQLVTSFYQLVFFKYYIVAEMWVPLVTYTENWKPWDSQAGSLGPELRRSSSARPRAGREGRGAGGEFVGSREIRRVFTYGGDQDTTKRNNNLTTFTVSPETGFDFYCRGCPGYQMFYFSKLWHPQGSGIRSCQVEEDKSTKALAILPDSEAGWASDLAGCVSEGALVGGIWRNRALDAAN